MKLNSKLFISSFGSLLTVILDQSIDQNCCLENLLSDWISLMETSEKSRGTKDTIQFFKQVHLIATKVAMGRPMDPLKFCKSSKDGTPSIIKPLMPFLKGTASQKRVGLSMTKLYLAYNLKPSTDFSSITTESPGGDYSLGERWFKFLTFWVKKFKTPNLGWDGWWHATTKNGPNGPGLVTAHQDLISISSDPKVWEAIKSWTSLTSVPLSNMFSSLSSKWSTERNAGYSHSKLGLIPEGGGKTRQIAMADYFTQESLRSIFRWSMGALKQLETDGTYNQSWIVDKTSQAMSDGKPIHCMDLSAATDRFPVSLQEDFLCHVIGPDSAKAWRTLLTNSEFEHKFENVRYAVGQPMGMMSSWSIFSLTHHAIIEYCAFEEGINSFSDYVMLGDDVAIFNTQVAERYTAIMTEAGMEMSMPKSFHWVPGDTFPPSAEIAKRLLYSEEEMTPIPWDLAQTWSASPLSEVITLKFGLSNLGINLEPAAWETLSASVSKSSSREFVILSLAPEELLGSNRGLCAHFTGVPQGPWEEVDFTLLPTVLAEILMKDLESKNEKMIKLHSELFEEHFWDRFKDRSGKPISHSVLGLGSLDWHQLHPLVVVINNRLEGLWSVEELIAKLQHDPQESGVKWEDVYNADFQITTTFVDEKSKSAWTQATVLSSLFKALPKMKDLKVDKPLGESAEPTDIPTSVGAQGG